MATYSEPQPFWESLERRELPQEAVLDSFGSTAFLPLTKLPYCANKFKYLKAHYQLEWHTRSLLTPNCMTAC